MRNLEKLIDQPYIFRWPNEWTNKVNAMKKSGEDGDETRRLKTRNNVRVPNCMKMYGLGITSRGYLIVRDHKSRKEPIFFWRHSPKGKGKDAEEWKVSTGSDGDRIGWPDGY